LLIFKFISRLVGKVKEEREGGKGFGNMVIREKEKGKRGRGLFDTRIEKKNE